MAETKRIRYAVFTAQQQKKFDEFADAKMFFAFNNEQFAEGMAKFKLNPKKKSDRDKVCRTLGGGYILKENLEEFHALIDQLDNEKNAYICENEENAYDAMLYELQNHEYCVTLDPSNAIRDLGLSVDEINGSEMLKKAFLKACRVASKEE